MKYKQKKFGIEGGKKVYILWMTNINMIDKFNRAGGGENRNQNRWCNFNYG